MNCQENGCANLNEQLSRESSSDHDYASGPGDGLVSVRSKQREQILRPAMAVAVPLSSERLASGTEGEQAHTAARKKELRCRGELRLRGLPRKGRAIPTQGLMPRGMPWPMS